MDKIDYQYFTNNDFVIEIYKGLYFDNLNNFISKHNYVKLQTKIKNFKIYYNDKIIDLTSIDVTEYHLILNKIKIIYLEYNNNKIAVNFEKKCKDIDLYCLELNIILLETLKLFDFDLTTEIKNVNEFKIITERLVFLRKNIGKFKRFCTVKGYIFNNEINEKYLKILLGTKKLLNLFNNENYYYTEIKKIINNNKSINIKQSISIIHKNMFLLDKIFKNYQNNIKSLEQQIHFLSNNFNKKESLEQYFSLVAQTNWLDNLQENQFCGLLIRTTPNNNFIINKNIDTINITHITRSTIDLDMYFSFINQYYNKYNKYDDGNGIPLIKGNGLGEGNMLLPIYINNIHWKLAKNFIPIFTAIATTLNPALFIKNSLYLYHHTTLNMFKETFENKNLDEKWLNMLMTMFITTYEVNKMCDKINWDEFIEQPIKRLYNTIQSNTQILGHFLIDGIEIYRNNKEKFYSIFQLIFEEYLRRIKPYKFKYIQEYFINIMNNDYKFIKISDNINEHTNEYFLLNSTILGIILFDKLLGNKNFKEYKEDFINNYSLLTYNQIDEIKNFIKNNHETFELTIKNIKYLINPFYPQIDINSMIKSYPINSINNITIKYLGKELITKKQLECMLIQNAIQCNEKSRRLAIEKGKYFNPYINYEKIIFNCHEYYKKRIIYETIERIKTKDELLNSLFYSYYQNNIYKNILNEYITNNKLIKDLLDTV